MINIFKQKYPNMEKNYSAVERINMILDKGTFIKIDIENEFMLDEKGSVLTGYGTIHSKKVYIYAQDSAIIAGTLGLAQGKKIASVIKKAIIDKCPIIGINASGGARLQEGVDALAGYGEIFYYNSLASGYIPQISIIAGVCAGGACYSPGLTDFVFTINDISKMFLTGPRVVKCVTNQECSQEELGGAEMHSIYSGVSHINCENERECFKKVRDLVKLLPSCYETSNTKIHPKYIKKSERNIGQIVPVDERKVYNIKLVIDEILDKNSFFEIQKDFAKNIVVGFGRINNLVIGIVANQPNYCGGTLDCDTSNKAARFIRFCDAFNIPVITLVDTPGYMPGVSQERNGVIRHGAKLLFAYTEANVLKITIILRKAFGGAYIAMGSKHLGTNYVYAWNNAQVAIMGAEGAVYILYSKQLNALEGRDREEFLKEKMFEYKEKHLNINQAVAQGYIDAIIKPNETRKQIYYHLIRASKKADIFMINKKHGCIPL